MPGIRLIHDKGDEQLYLVAARPLRDARVLISTPDVLLHFRRDGSEHPVVGVVDVIGENELGPDEDTQFIAKRIKRIGVGSVGRVDWRDLRVRRARLVCAAAPYTELWISSVGLKGGRTEEHWVTYHVLTALDRALYEPADLLVLHTRVEGIEWYNAGALGVERNTVNLEVPLVARSNPTSGNFLVGVTRLGQPDRTEADLRVEGQGCVADSQRERQVVEFGSAVSVRPPTFRKAVVDCPTGRDEERRASCRA